nr:MAG TPA: hypothetical protein [Caudoviricetes sp.]
MAQTRKNTPDTRRPSYADARQQVSHTCINSAGRLDQMRGSHWAWADGA